MLTDGLIRRLKADPTLSALTMEIVPVGIVKGIKSPCIVYQIGTVLDTREATGSSGYRLARCQFDCYSASSYAESKNVAKAVRGIFKSFHDQTLLDGTYVQAALIDFESDEPFVPTGVQAIEFRTLVQVSVWYRET